MPEALCSWNRTSRLSQPGKNALVFPGIFLGPCAPVHQGLPLAMKFAAAEAIAAGIQNLSRTRSFRRSWMSQLHRKLLRQYQVCMQPAWVELTTMHLPLRENYSGKTSEVFWSNERGLWCPRCPGIEAQAEGLVRLRNKIVEYREKFRRRCVLILLNPFEADALRHWLVNSGKFILRFACCVTGCKNCLVTVTCCCSGSVSYIRYEPKGVVLIMSPWNYPINLSLTAGGCLRSGKQDHP